MKWPGQEEKYVKCNNLKEINHERCKTNLLFGQENFNYFLISSVKSLKKKNNKTTTITITINNHMVIGLSGVQFSV